MSRSNVNQIWLTVALAALALAALFAPRLFARATPGTEPAAEASADGAEEPAPLDRNLLEILKEGGPMIAPLLACSFLTLVFVLERAISLRRGRVIPRPFVKRFLHQIREGKLDRDAALALCQESSSPIAEVFAAIVRKWGRPSVELEQTVIDAGDRASGTLRRYVRLFNAMATISPLMGLLGTVFGMIRLFSAISTASAMGRTELLAAGISEALLATAAGLLIAIPALCFYLFFMGRVERLLIEIDHLGQELVTLISAEALHDDRQGKIRSKPRPPAAA